MNPIFKWSKGRMIAAAVLLAMFILSALGTLLTMRVMEHLSFLQSEQPNARVFSSHKVVDQRPWKTAEALAGLAVSTEERDLAREAERLADHEVDQAFAQALREAGARTHDLKGDALILRKRVTELEQTVKQEQSRLAASDDPDVAKAQLGLDQDELADLTEDLARESGDDRGTIQQELSAREASMKKYDEQVARGNGETAVASAENYQTLAGQVSVWWAQRGRTQLLLQAERLARADVTSLAADHNRLEALAKADEAKMNAGSMTARSGQERVKELQRLGSQRKVLSIIDDRVSTQRQLATLYGKWHNQLQLEHGIVVHLMLRSLAWITAILLATLLIGWGLQIALDRMSSEPRQRQTLRTILNLGTELMGLIFVLLVIFGTPSQMPTILGLATAGLTVVFQDFILAFCGWFVLMGRSGIRVGDWVEIDGVGGEVVGVGLFRTWLLETGNWTAHGHPTGRRISFLNGFAIRGKYFNFSTAGQWMWDEIKVSIPAEVDAYPLIEQIRQAAVKATEADAKLAEEEWKRVASGDSLPQFSATPSIDVRPAGAGLDIVVRYVTRAGLRLETRNRLFSSIVDLMHSEGTNAKK